MHLGASGQHGQPQGAAPGVEIRHPGRVARVAVRAGGGPGKSEVRDALGAGRSGYVKKPLNTMAGRGWVAFAEGRWCLTGTLTEQDWKDIETGESICG